jgi:hypothetical protein
MSYGAVVDIPAIPTVKVGNRFDLWLESQWDNLFDYRPRSVI